MAGAAVRVSRALDIHKYLPSPGELLIFPRHLFRGQLRLRVHYGKTKLEGLNELDDVDVVLTTYHTVSAELKIGARMRQTSVLFSTNWRRIILDEGDCP